MKSPLVSIVTPCYNQERFISHCIESVRGQSYGNWEQIVVDDGSDDRTAEIVRSYDDPRIRYVRLPHRGLSALGETYNTALSLARGELVAVLEGDDFWPAEKLERQVPAFEDLEVFLTWGRGALVDADGRKVGERASIRTRKPARRFSNRQLFARLTRVNVVAPAITVMLRRSALDQAGGFQQSGSTLYVDLPTWLRVTAVTPGYACFLNTVLGCYRTHPQQTTRRYRALMDAQHVEVVMQLEQQLDPQTLQAAGWNGTVRRRALLGGLLAQGTTHLSEGEFARARESFRKALAEADTARDRLKAGLGVVSTFLEVDLLSAAGSLRDSGPFTLWRS